MKKGFKIVTLTALIFLMATLFCVFLANFVIGKATDRHVFDDIDDLPHKKVGLILGTSQYIANGQHNVYFKGRIDAAAELYEAGKIDYMIVSGDNHLMEYNEPVDMQGALLAKGIPEEKIYLDYAGFRTLDSVVRADKIFSQKDFIVVSQEFHNRRAIYIAKRLGLKAVGYNAENAQVMAPRVRIREALARVKVFIDLMVGAKPKFLGEKIEIGAKEPAYPIEEEAAKSMIEARAKAAIVSLKRRDMATFSALIHPEKGVRLSPYAYVDKEKNLVFSAKDFENFLTDDVKYIFGAFDGTGEPIELSGKKYFDKFIYDRDFALAEEVSYNRTIGSGNSLENQFEVYPESIIVEYYFSGFEEKYGGLDWESLRLAFEWRNGDWYVVGIIHNQWTI